ncbi:uncharacterized protein LOC112081523 [Eutrema salsugineum]|uniref:uncharacterized protein LOC112081523 n=1 Tax=Eutrema salsugineum TaxID=72664 RepID=UPI000CECEB53|nr:uncharacterized protein LOC112081523 [Eutrema salsugineum]
MAMSLEEEEVPFDLPDTPAYCSSDKNEFSLIGRLLNPDCQRMANLILDLPRKWQKYDRVRGVHTFNEWALATERWEKQPSSETLQFVPIWVQIRNIPINHYTEEAFTALGDLVGLVTEIAFDPTKAKNKEFVRVKALAAERRLGSSPQKQIPKPVLLESDPLFGVLGENQVGVNPLMGRPRIVAEVLQGMRQYLLIANGDDRKVREDRVKKSVCEAEKNLITQKIVFRLEPVPIITRDLNKGKGPVFGYSSEDSTTKTEEIMPRCQKLMSAAIRADASSRRIDGPNPFQVVPASLGFSVESSPFQNSSTGYRIGHSGAGPSRTMMKKSKPRKRPPKSRRKLKKKLESSIAEDVEKNKGSLVGSMEKRKAVSDLESVSKAARSKTHEIVPNEGLSNL